MLRFKDSVAEMHQCRPNSILVKGGFRSHGAGDNIKALQDPTAHRRTIDSSRTREGFEECLEILSAIHSGSCTRHFSMRAALVERQDFGGEDERVEDRYQLLCVQQIGRNLSASRLRS